MPGVVQHTTDSLKRAAAEAVELGLGGIMLSAFRRSATPSAAPALDPDGVLNQAHPRRPGRGRRRPGGDERCLPGRIHRPRALRRARRPTARGQRRHAGIYAEMAVAQAEAGADMLGPSGMMDGQVA